MIGLGKYTGLSAVAASAVVYHAFATREQFYPSMQYLTSSKLSIAVMGNLAFALSLCMYRLLIQMFLGTLREAEVERINERISQAVMETCLAMTIFREEFNIAFIAMFASLTFVKVFHWLVQDRVDYIETTPTVSLGQHVKIVSLMGLLLMVDALFLQYTISATLARGPSVLLLFAFEYVIQASLVVSTFLKYGFIGVDMMLEGRWESKGVYVFYLELITDMLHLFVYLIFFIIVFTYYGLPLHLVRDLYWTFRNFRQRVSDFLRYRRVTANMNERFPDASAEDLARCDGTCIICREEMSPTTANKKLPCGHVFHLTCLRSWLERQQNCPTCRANVLGSRPADAPAAEPQMPEGERPAAAPREGQAAVIQGNGAGPAARQPADAQQPAAVAAPQPAAGPAPQAPPAPTHQARAAAQAPAAAPASQPATVQRHQDAAPRPSQGTVRRRHPPSDNGAASASTDTMATAPPAQPQPAHGWHFYNSPMGMFPGMMPMQYAGQQPAVPPASAEQAAAYMLPRMSVPMVPMSMLLPQPTYAMPATSSGATPEQHQAAAAAAAAATAALFNPWSSLAMMPPAMPQPEYGAANSQHHAASASAAAALASAAAAAAVISSSSQAPATATQVLQNHINFLQSHMQQLEGAAPPSVPSAKGKEKVDEAMSSSATSQESAATAKPETPPTQPEPPQEETTSGAQDTAEGSTTGDEEEKLRQVRLQGFQ